MFVFNVKSSGQPNSHCKGTHEKYPKIQSSTEFLHLPPDLRKGNMKILKGDFLNQAMMPRPVSGDE